MHLHEHLDMCLFVLNGMTQPTTYLQRVLTLLKEHIPQHYVEEIQGLMHQIKTYPYLGMLYITPHLSKMHVLYLSVSILAQLVPIDPYIMAYTIWKGEHCK
jgi:hypothetical protein